MSGFFERQSESSKNCSVHSLNNALGYTAVTPESVAANIDKRLETFARYMGMVPTDPKLRFYRDRMATGNTFFSADAVWRAAQDMGIIEKPVPISGFGGDFAFLRPDMVGMRLVILGIGHDGAYHATAVRDGLLYDSLKDEPVPLTDENLSEIYKRIFAAFQITEPVPSFEIARSWY